MTKNEVKLHTKIEKLLPQINEMYLTTYQFHSTQPLDVLESWLMILKQRVIEPSIEFVYGKGKPFTNVKWKHSKITLKNGQLKPGYHVQIGVEAGYIVHVGIFVRPMMSRR